MWMNFCLYQVVYHCESWYRLYHLNKPLSLSLSPILGSEFSLSGVNTPWARTGLHIKGWSSLKEGSHYQQMSVTDFKTTVKMSNLILTPPRRSSNILT